MKEKLRAASIHFALSAIVILGVLGLVYLGWYEGVFSKIQNLGKVLLIVICVDIVLGPLLTFVVYKKHKKSLKFDLTVIALIQLAFLSYGVHSVYAARPAFLVFAVDRFEAISLLDWPEDTKPATSDASTPNLFSPKLVAALLPKDPKERENLMFSSTAGGADITQLPKLYVPYKAVLQDVIKRAQPLSALKALNPNATAYIDQIASSLGKPNDELGYLPLKGRHGDAAVIVDKKTGSVLAKEFLIPW
jgi:hypothetical protein